MEDKDLAQTIEDIQKAVEPVGQAISDKVSELVETYRPVFTAAERFAREFGETYGPIISRIGESFRIWIENNSQALKLIGETIIDFSRKAKEWQEAQKVSVTYMAQNGWFPNWYTFNFKPSDETFDLDSLMIDHINESWDEIADAILKKCPNRSPILKVAFQLHKTGNFIASIPLFLSQADGIFCEEIKSFLFAGEKPKESIERMVESGEIQKWFLEDILLEPYKIKTQFQEGMSKASKVAKSKAPNRHGIMHGYRKHLDYGTELNSCKCFSLLAFVVFSVKDVFKQHN